MPSALVENDSDIIRQKASIKFEDFDVTASRGEIGQIFDELNQVEFIPVWVDYENLISKPIFVKTYRRKDLFFAENDNLVVYAAGGTLDEAIQSLRTRIIHFYIYYRDIDENKLIADAVRLKALYKDLFIG